MVAAARADRAGHSALLEDGAGQRAQRGSGSHVGSYAAQVFRESFLKSAAAGRMGVPTVPLTELYSAAGEYIRARGGEVQLARRGRVDSVPSLPA